MDPDMFEPLIYMFFGSIGLAAGTFVGSLFGPGTALLGAVIGGALGLAVCWVDEHR